MNNPSGSAQLMSFDELAASLVDDGLGAYLKKSEIRAMVVNAVAKNTGIPSILVHFAYRGLVVPAVEAAEGKLKDEASTLAKSAGQVAAKWLGESVIGKLLEPFRKLMLQVKLTQGQTDALRRALTEAGFEGAADADLAILDREADIRERVAAEQSRKAQGNLDHYIRDQMEQLLRQIEVQPDLDWVSAPDEPGVHLYNRSNQPWVGREHEFDELRRFRNSPLSFSWWAIVGDGGIGKSRLAFEFSGSLREDGWRAGNFPVSSGRFAWTDWEVLFPTLLVIDDASTRVDEVRTIIETIGRRGITGQLPNPVRLILIDRHEGFLEKLRRNELVRQTFVEPTSFGSPLRLKSLAAPALRQLAVELIGEASHDKVELTLAALDSVDKYQRRPLYLRFIAEAVVRGQNPSGWDRLGLLRSQLRNLEDVRWPKAEAGITSGEIDTDRCLLAFATLAGPLRFAELDRYAARGVPVPVRTSPAQIARLAIMVDAPKLWEHLPGLRPDILGELFVLDFLADRKIFAPEAVAAMLDAGWSLHPVSMWSFFRQSSDDWRDHADRVSLLEYVPAVGARAHWAPLFCDEIVRGFAAREKLDRTLSQLLTLREAYCGEPSHEILDEIERATVELVRFEHESGLEVALDAVDAAIRLAPPVDGPASGRRSVLQEIRAISSIVQHFMSLGSELQVLCTRKFGVDDARTDRVLAVIGKALEALPHEHPAREPMGEVVSKVLSFRNANDAIANGNAVLAPAKRALTIGEALIRTIKIQNLSQDLRMSALLFGDLCKSIGENGFQKYSREYVCKYATDSVFIVSALRSIPADIPRELEALEEPIEELNRVLAGFMVVAAEAGLADELRGLAVALLGIDDGRFTVSYVEGLEFDESEPKEVAFKEALLSIVLGTGVGQPGPQPNSA